MCQYRYHYYSQCKHQELLCFRFCERATALKKKSKGKKQPPKTEGATRGGGPSASLTYAKVASSTASKVSKVASGTAKRSGATAIHHDPSFDNHRSSPINSSTMTKVTNRPRLPQDIGTKSSENHRPSKSSLKTSSQADTRHAQEASQRYNEMLREGDLPAGPCYSALEAEMAIMQQKIRLLEGVRDDTNHSPASDDYISVDYDSGSDDTVEPESAAARLQRIHDRCSRTSSQTASSDVGEETNAVHLSLQAESFPVLGSPSTCPETPPRQGSVASYAKVVKGSTSNRSWRQDKQHVQHRTHHVPQQDSEWVVVDRSDRVKGSVRFPTSESATSGAGQSSTPRHPQTFDHFARSGASSSTLRSSISPRSARPSDIPTLATEKRAVDRRLRKSLPENWLQTYELTTPSPNYSPRSHAAETLRNIAKSSTTKVSVHANHGSARDCVDSCPSHSLKSKPSKSTLSKVTAPGTPSYATATAASKHRSAGTADTDNAPAPYKNKNTRVGADPGMESIDMDQHDHAMLSSSFASSHRKKTNEKAKKVDSSPPMWNDMQGFTRRILPFGIDGSNDHHEVDVLQISSGNAMRQSTRRNKVDLNIAIPDHSTQPRFVRAVSPPRIPVSAYHSGSENSAILVPTQTSTAEPRRNTVERLAKRDGESSENDGGQKPLRRASILEPIRRRLSAASSRSRSGSTVSTTGPEQHLIATESKDVEPTIDNAFIDQSTQTDVTITAINKKSRLEVPDDTVACLRKPFPSPTDSLEPASSRLLDTIKQTAKDHTERLNDELELPSVPEESHVSVESHRSLPADLARKPSTSCIPEQDAAVLECGPTKMSVMTDNSRSFMVNTGSFHNAFGATSLRATAPTFVPTSVHALFAPPKPCLSPHTPSAETSSSQPFSQCTNLTNITINWMPLEEWQALSPSERYNIKNQRRERGSSSSSSNGPSSAGYSSNMTLSSSFTPRYPLGSSERRRAQWNWFASCRDGNGSPVRFGRASLPTMPEGGDNDESSRKGWGIGSAAPGWWYGWKGGDGLEISFTGHGPDAEKNSNAPVNFHDHEKGSCQRDVTLPNQTQGQYIGGNMGMPNAFTSPQRTRGWAGERGYPALPCGTFEVTDAFEHVGVPETRNFVDGWCHTCWPPR